MDESGDQWEPLRRTMAALDAEVAAASPRCDLSGRCCRFLEYGHTLFLSRWEAEWLITTPIPADTTINEATCPYQREGLCTARETRPLGCRVYFCDPAYQDQQGELSERYLRQLKQLHDEAQRPWNYQPLHRHLAALSMEAE